MLVGCCDCPRVQWSVSSWCVAQGVVAEAAKLMSKADTSDEIQRPASK